MFGLAIIAIFWTGLFYHLSVEHTRELDAAIERGNSQARLFEGTTIRLIKEVDRSLLLFRLAYEKNPGNFDMREWAQQTSLLGDQTIQASLVGADGYIAGSTVENIAGPIFVGDREHFKAQVDARSDELFISKPVVGRASGKSSIRSLAAYANLTAALMALSSLLSILRLSRHFTVQSTTGQTTSSFCKDLMASFRILWLLGGKLQ